LGLVGETGERLVGNAGRKTEIILDAALAPALPAEGAGVEDDHREALGCGIDGGREAGGTRSDDRDITGLIAFIERHHSERAPIRLRSGFSIGS
jgi:hypothetical protein